MKSEELLQGEEKGEESELESEAMEAEVAWVWGHHQRNRGNL